MGKRCAGWGRMATWRVLNSRWVGLWLALQLMAQVRVMMTGLEEQRRVLKQEIEAYKPSAWRAALEAPPAASLPPGHGAMVAKSATGGGGGAAFAKELDEVQVLIQGAAHRLQGE